MCEKTALVVLHGAMDSPHEAKSRSCGECSHCHVVDPEVLGECRRYAPRAMSGYSAAYFPSVHLAICWCGEFNQKGVTQ